MSDKQNLLAKLADSIDRYHESHGRDEDLLAIRDEVTKQTEGEDRTDDDDEGLVDRIGNAIERFETEHFELTDSLSQAAYFLSGDGL